MGIKAGLSAQHVTTAATALVDEHGWAALSLKELAARLGVKPPSLYNHVAGLPGLQRLLRLHACRLLGAALQKAAVGRARGDAVTALALAYRGFVLQHPGLADATVEAPAPDDSEHLAASEAVLEVLAAVLAGYGLPRVRFVHAARALRSGVHGFAMLEARGGFGLKVDVDQSFAWLVEMLVAALEREAGRPNSAAAP
jgi:AcrR family transcriptional regulator